MGIINLATILATMGKFRSNGSQTCHIELSVLLLLVCLLSLARDAGGAAVRSSAKDGVSVAATTSVPLPNLIGINIAAPLDYEEDRLYADVIPTSRSFIKDRDPNSPSMAEVDALGWPMTDFSFYAWAGISQMQGVYTLTFKGQAQVKANPVGNVDISYDEATNTSTGKFRYTDSSSNFLTLSFVGTKRTPSSAVGSGVTSIKLMRPLTPGAMRSYPPERLFNDPLKALIAKFSVVRFMDFLATNWNPQKHWNDRALPSFSSFNRRVAGDGWQGLGGPWEHVILFMNETGKDGWINIPAAATDDYILKVAQMFAFGSDGVNPYTNPQTNPVYPPLSSDLKLYVEYSNELWNNGFSQTKNICQYASDELGSAAGKSPLNWDNVWNKAKYTTKEWNWDMCPRYAAKRSVEISNIFRKVFGDSAMTARIRPVLMTQLGSAERFLGGQAKMMLNYYNNMAGNFVTTPRPPNYYFYGAGGSVYYQPDGPVTTLDEFFDDSAFKPVGLIPMLEKDAAIVAAMGLKRIAYEGGPNLMKSDSESKNALYARAVNDARMTKAIVDMHNAWSNYGGELLVYYTATISDFQWAFAPDVYNLETKKMQAIDLLNVSNRAPLTLGTQVPGKIAGNIPATCFTGSGSGCAPINAWDNFTADGSKVVWASYSFRSSLSVPWTVKLSLAKASKDAEVAVYIDGKLIGSKQATGLALDFKAGTINPGLHGAIVRAAKGTFSLNSVAVSTN